MTSAPSVFSQINLTPPVEAFKLKVDYKSDPAEQKVDLGSGMYRDGNGKPWVLPVVRSIEAQIVTDPELKNEYLPISGLPAFCKAATELCLGSESRAIAENRAGGVQALSGTGALRIAGEFLKRFYRIHVPSTVVAMPDPTWGNHDAIFRYSGFTDRRKYRYWDAKNRRLDFEGMKEDLAQFPEYSIIILHACAHNPTGTDPSHEQWNEIMEVCKQRNHFPIFDSAYQGFASGDPESDGWTMRAFEKAGFEFMVCQSFSKILGLYDKRVGNIVIVTHSSDALSRTKAQMELIVYGMYLNPPSHGARIATAALGNPSYYLEWRDNIRSMSERIKHMRKLLYEKLKILETPGTWEHIIDQIGMFSYTGLNEAQCDFLVKQKHVYLLKSGRICVSGLSESNVDYFANALHEAVTTI